MGKGPIMVVVGSIFGSIFLSSLLMNISVYDIAGSERTSIGNRSLSRIALPITQRSTPVTSDQECKVSPGFPESIRIWCGQITRYAQEYHLDPDLIAALIWQESGGNPSAYSHSGAVGLMQIMPRDGLAAAFMCVNGPCFTNRPTIDQLINPEFNLLYGTKMLSGLQAKYGNMRDALKAYGPMDVGYSYADKVLSLYQSYRTSD